MHTSAQDPSAHKSSRYVAGCCCSWQSYGHYAWNIIDGQSFSRVCSHPVICCRVYILFQWAEETPIKWMEMMWGGNDSRTMPFDRQKSIPATDRCDQWLSRRRSTYDSGVTRVCLAKCWRKARKSISCIQPELFAEPAEPMGPFLTKWFWNFFLGNMKYGEMQLPCAFTARAMVTNVPLSQEVTEPTWCFSLEAIILSGTWTGTWKVIINFDKLLLTFVGVYS